MSETSEQALNLSKDLRRTFNTRWSSTEPPCIVYASRIPPRRPGTLRTWLGSARNFGKTRFGRFAIFDFLTPIFFFEIFFRIFFSVFHDFRQILEDLVNFGRQNQVRGGILLRMDRFSGPYDLRLVRVDV